MSKDNMHTSHELGRAIEEVNNVIFALEAMRDLVKRLAVPLYGTSFSSRGDFDLTATDWKIASAVDQLRHLRDQMKKELKG